MHCKNILSGTKIKTKYTRFNESVGYHLTYNIRVFAKRTFK